MKVTCSILCYNYGRYLAQAIESCLAQQPGNYELEILIIDDGSTDETPEVCALYADRVRVLRSENQGFGASIDKAFTNATGDYVCLLDADDYFAPEKIVSLLPWMEEGNLYIQHPKYLVDSNGELIQAEPEEGGNTSTICVERRAALTLLPCLNEVFFHPLFLAGHGQTLEQSLAFYRLHDSSMMRGQKRDSWLRHHAKVTHILSDKLLAMSQQPINTYFWANAHTLRKISYKFRAVANYDETEAALIRGNRVAAQRSALKIAYHTIKSGNLKSPYWKVVLRGLLGYKSR